MSALQGLEKEKSYCENTKKPTISFPAFDPHIFIDKGYVFVRKTILPTFLSFQ